MASTFSLLCIVNVHLQQVYVSVHEVLLSGRRWVMSGTPTPSTPTSHVAHLQPLLAFLHHQPYGTQKKVWEVSYTSFTSQLL